MAIAREPAQRFDAGRRIARPLWPVILVLGAFAAGSPAQSEDGFLHWIVQSVSTDEEGAVGSLGALGGALGGSGRQ